MFCVGPRENVSIDNEQSRFTIRWCVWWGVWECWSVGPGNKRNLLVRAYQPLCGEMERDVGEETGVVIVRMNVIVAYQALPRLMWDVFS